MRHGAHIAIPIALLQVLAVILGVIFMRVTFLGVEDSVLQSDRYRLARIVRNQGYLLLAVPLLWTCGVLLLESRKEDWWSRRWTVLSGLILLLGLGFIFHDLCSTTYHRLSRDLQMKVTGIHWLPSWGHLVFRATLHESHERLAPGHHQAPQARLCGHPGVHQAGQVRERGGHPGI